MDGTTSLKKNQYNLKTHIMSEITINKTVDFEVIYLKVDAGVRYWEDTEVNGVQDTDCEETDGAPTIPCAEYVGDRKRILNGGQWRWRPLIDIENGIIVNWKQGTTANIHYKVCDDFQCDILNGDKDVIISYEGYVPKIMCPADKGYGDYIIMNIDENGFIQGWNKELIKELVKQGED